MFELRRARTIGGANGPAVRQHFSCMSARVNHGLNCKNRASLQSQASMWATILRDLRDFMQRMTDAVCNKFAHGPKALRFRVALDGRANVTQAVVRGRRIH